MCQALVACTGDIKEKLKNRGLRLLTKEDKHIEWLGCNVLKSLEMELENPRADKREQESLSRRWHFTVVGRKGKKASLCPFRG